VNSSGDRKPFGKKIVGKKMIKTLGIRRDLPNYLTQIFLPMPFR